MPSVIVDGIYVNTDIYNMPSSAVVITLALLYLCLTEIEKQHRRWQFVHAIKHVIK